MRGLVLNIAAGTVLKIAGSIGSEELTPTIERVLKPENGGSRSLIDLAVRLEHFSKFPQDEVVDFRGKKLSADQIMPAAVVRRLIIRRFHLFPDRKELKAKICDLYGIARTPFQLGTVSPRVGRE